MLVLNVISRLLDIFLFSDSLTVWYWGVVVGIVEDFLDECVVDRYLDIYTCPLIRFGIIMLLSTQCRQNTRKFTPTLSHTPAKNQPDSELNTDFDIHPNF